MAGALTISTLNDSSGVLATQNGMTGIAKAWVRFDGSTAGVASSFNISSVTRTATGKYTYVFTTSMPNANYSVLGMGSTNGSGGEQIAVAMNSTTTISASGFSSTTQGYGSGYNIDPAIVCIAVFSS
jgi:hypothetical protein